MRRHSALLLGSTLALALLCWSTFPAVAQKTDRIPHGQDSLPGPPLSPQEAIQKMTVPPGFTVELVAGEPDIVNPVAMTFDERGRVWIAESLEYPRSSAGPGRDRVKILEDTDGDGKADKFTVFAEGLNIPSGIAVGHGGVWVANSPDILLYKIGPDGKAAGKPEIVVTGFGRADTHELPNSLTWGPDGWLYGLNGVFNPSHVKHQGKEFRFTCALFRIHPKTREFQLFAEGTSNPWGVAWDTEGSAFVSACVIDHLWHLAETGYYHRQGGPYPPFTWKLGSIVQHKHQKAAYCGIHFFDSDAYPPEYRQRLYMGNIHGGCINVDVLQRDGATYFAKPAPDFLTANDPWFMPVVQKTGPDGCLYILDWYDRYHCYQDARRDPEGIDRLRGRLYRVRYKDTPRAPSFDLARESDHQLLERLRSPNVYFRDIAQRLLSERSGPGTRQSLWKLVLDEAAPRKARMHALWALIGGGPLEVYGHLLLLEHKDPSYRAWGVRAAVNGGKVADVIRDKVVALTRDPSPDVQLQVAIAARKLDGVDPLLVLTQVLKHCGQDKVIPVIVWQNLHPLLEKQAGEFLGIAALDLLESPQFAPLVPRVFERILALKELEAVVIAGMLAILQTARDDRGRQCVNVLTSKIQSGELAPKLVDELGPRLQGFLTLSVNGPVGMAAHADFVALAATLKHPDGLLAARTIIEKGSDEAHRLKALDALIFVKDSAVLKLTKKIVEDYRSRPAFRGQVLVALGKLDDPQVANLVLSHYSQLEPELQPKAIELLTQRPAWTRALLEAIDQKRVPANALNLTQVRRLLASKDQGLREQVRKVWGTVREDRDPQREQVVTEMRALLRKTPGDAAAGIAVYNKVCGQCHKLHGEGVDVGPDITSNGRSDFEQLLSNVFDPNLVIGSSYQGTTVFTKKGQSISGLVVEDSPQRVVLKVQGGKLETIARGDIEEIAQSKVSLMPEALEKQVTPQEMADLFAFLCLDRPPGDPKARKIPGAP